MKRCYSYTHEYKIGMRPYLNALNLQFHVVFARGLPVFTFLPAVAVAPIPHLLPAVEHQRPTGRPAERVTSHVTLHHGAARYVTSHHITSHHRTARHGPSRPVTSTGRRRDQTTGRGQPLHRRVPRNDPITTAHPISATKTPCYVAL